MNKHKIIDFRSDTVTKPTPEMRKAMSEAVVGDDVFGEDTTVIELEKTATEMLGKEAAIFVPSGTFGNQLSFLTHCRHGDELIISDHAHPVQYEAGAAAVIAGVQLRTIRNLQREWISWDEIEPLIRKSEDIHFPKTGLIEIQNTLGNGAVMPLETMSEIKQNAEKYKIPVHLDGARIFNAAAALNVNVVEISKYADSVMFCLSKGLCAPIGSMLAGSEEFISKARFNRKLMGGGMRQVGVLAAPGLIALKTMSKRLAEDHENARKLAQIFSEYEIFDIQPENVKTNIFYLRFKSQNPNIAEQFIEKLKSFNILTTPPRFGACRFVTHFDIKTEDIDFTEKILPKIVKEITV
jgi:threonine aldolase